VVATTDGIRFSAFHDPNYADGVGVAQDVGGQGYTLDLDLEDSEHGQVTLDLPQQTGISRTVGLRFPGTD